MEWKIRSAYVRSKGHGLAGVAVVMFAGCGVNRLDAPPTNYTHPCITLQGQVFAGRNYMAY